MRLSRQVFSARFRIIFLAVVAIVIPSLVLSVFGLKLNTEQLQRVEEFVSRAYQTAAETRIARIVEEVQRQEQGIVYPVLDCPVEELVRRVPELEKPDGLVDEFFVLSPAREIFYPPTRPEIIPEPIELVPGPEGGGALLRAGYELEFGRRSPDAAVKNYERCADGPFSAAFRIEALTSLGGCLFRLGRFDEAVTAYRRILEEFDSEAVPVPYRLLARYQASCADEAAGRVRESRHGLTSLYADLLEQPAAAGGSDCWEFFREKVRAKLVAQTVSAGVPEEEQREFRRLEERERRRESRRLFRHDLAEWVVQRVQWETQGKAGEPGRIDHFHRIVDGRPYVVGYQRMKGGTKDGTSTLGFRMNLDYVKNQIVLPIIREQPFGEETVMVVVDRSGDPVVSSLPGGVAVVASGEPYAFTQEFPETFGFWRLGITGVGNREILRAGWNQYLLLSAILFLTITTMIIGVYFTIRNVSRELELSALKSEFVSRVSHELKTPLSLIRMFAETLLLGRVKTKEKEREYYEVINRESERLTKLIDHVLDFSRIESGRKEYRFEVENVVELVQWTAEAYRAGLESQGFSLQVVLPGEPLYARADRDALDQALINLLNNAEKYSADRKEIRLSVERGDREIRVQVTDHGIGIPREEQGRVFEKFYRGKDDRVRSVRGSGLGLAIARHAMEAHGGRIELTSRLGEGSTFTLVLPEIPPGEMADRPGSERPPGTRNGDDVVRDPEHRPAAGDEAARRDSSGTGDSENREASANAAREEDSHA